MPDQKGELATTLAILGLGLLTVGVIFGSTIQKPQTTQSSATEGCSLERGEQCTGNSIATKKWL